MLSAPSVNRNPVNWTGRFFASTASSSPSSMQKSWAAQASTPVSEAYSVEDCNQHLLWLRRRVRQMERRAAHADEESDDDDDLPVRSAGRAPLDLGHRVYPCCGFRVQSITRSAPCLTMLPRIVLGRNVDPYAPDDGPGPGAYDTAQY